MGRIPEEELERIKRGTDLVELVRSSGVELKAQGKDLVGRCVFHGPDETPSLVVTPDKQLYHCFACNAGGDVIEWVRRTQGLSFPHAVEVLREALGPEGMSALLALPAPRRRPASGLPPKESNVRRLPPPVEFDAEDHELLLQVVDYYHATLKSSPEALAYLAKRGLDKPEVVDACKLGYANRTLGLRLPTKQRADGRGIRERLARLGVIRASGREHLNGCLAVPVFGADGRVVELYGRKIGHQATRCAVHLYLPGPRRGVFNLAAFASKEIILCEALIDALTFACAGFPNVTSSYGVNGFTSEHLEAMRTHGTERVLLAYDHDEPGDRAAEELAKRLAAEGITSFRVRFPHGMDANEYACKVRPAAQSLAVLLRSAEYLAGPIVQRPLPVACSPLPVTVAAEAQPTSSAAAPGPASPLAAVSSAGEDAEPIDISDMVELVEPPAPVAPSLLSPEPSALSPASPIPPTPRADIPAEVSEQQVVMRFGDRHWRIRGLGKNLSFEAMRVNVFVGLDGHPERFHQDTIDLYAAKQRQAFIRTAAVELGAKEETVKKDLGTVLLKLEELQERAITKALEPKGRTVAIAEPDRAAALALLSDPHLLDRILEDFERCGVVGEETNKLVGYLAAISRKLERPLAVMVQSSSAAGKSALMNAVLAFVPEEERVAYSAMTGQSLFYMAETDLEHKVLAIAEEEGAERASYALKQLQSEGALSIASTGKDPATGRLVTHEYKVEGPAAIFMTTTAIDLDEELMNRCLVLTVDEDREQTRAIHRIQRQQQTLAGLLARRRRGGLLALHHNAQRLLRPLPVSNPYAEALTFLDDKTRMRRDHLKYLGLIEALTLLHQHQREHRTLTDGRDSVEVVVTSPADIEMANRLASEVLGHTLDELPPQTRRFLLLLDEMVREACQAKAIERSAVRFSRSDARRFSGWSLTQVRVHLDRLVEMEYVLIHHGSRGSSFVYELLWAGEGQEGTPFLMRLLDVGTLSTAPAYDPNLAGEGQRVAASSGEVAGSKRGHGGAKTGGWRSASGPQEAKQQAPSQGSEHNTAENAVLNEPETTEVVTGPRRNDNSRGEGGEGRENDNDQEAKPDADEEEDDDSTLLSLAASSLRRRP